MKKEIDWEKAEMLAANMTDADIGLEPGQKMFDRKEGRAAYLASVAGAKRVPGYANVRRDVRAQQTAARALRRMREKANITQAEVARRMSVKATAVSRLERFGATTLRALTDYARACGYTVSIMVKGHSEQFAMA